MVCNLLDIRPEIWMWLNTLDPFVSKVVITKCLNQYDNPWIIHCTLPFIRCTWSSSLYTIFSLSTSNCNIFVKIILQTPSRWTHEKEVMPTIVPYYPPIYLYLPNTREYLENTCVSPADVPHMQIHISPWSITNPVWTVATQLSLWKVPNRASSADAKCYSNSMPCGHLKCSNIYA